MKLLQLFTLLKLFIVVTLILFVLPEDVMAQMGQERGMRKYSLWGDITLQYDDMNTKSGGATDHRNMFTQNYKLNLRSYVISPKIMIYTINTGFDIRSGTLYDKGIAESYGIETVFFPRRPFSFSLRASKTDGPVYKSLDYGLSMNYTRKVRPRRVVTPPPVEGEENVNRNAGANLNTNTNFNTNDEGDYEYNANVNTARKPKAAVPRDEGLFSFIIDALPYSTYLDIDRTKNKFRGSLESKWDSAAARFAGHLRKTLYELNFDYHKWTQEGGTFTKGSGAELTTHTPLKWSFFQEFKNYVYYRKNDITSYDINSWLTGTKGKRRYEIYANYFSTSNGESAKQYSILADVRNAVPYTYKKVDIFYDAGIGFERLENKNDFFAKGRLSANKRLSLNTNLNSSLGVRGGTEYSEADFLTGISYTFRPRKGYAINMEIDPLKGSLKTQTMKPRVSGWDYLIRTGYTFGISKTTLERTEAGWGGATWTNKTMISHRADLNINVYLRLLTISSDAYLYYINTGKRLEWNNSIYTTVMRKIGITIGTGLLVDMPEDGTKTTNYNIYNLITYNLRRNALLRIDTRYTKTIPVDTTTLEVTPSLSWAWRRVFVDLEVRLKTDKTSNGAVTKERWIMLRVTRPFTIL